MFKATLLVSALAYSSLSFAGGPLVLGGAAGTTPVTYQNPNITLNIESGDLNETTSNAEATALVLQALALWNNVDTSNIKLLIDQTQILEDIDINNYQTYLPNPGGTVFRANDNLNPVVYDRTGKIIDAFFGENQSSYTVGFAASIITVGNIYFDEGYVVINGKDLYPQLTQAEKETTLKLLIAHEIGHFFGLDHSQANINNQETDFGSPALCNTSPLSSYPLMYPFVCRNKETLHQDDISAISALYPSVSTTTDFGILQGRFIDASGNAILGANIWAENTTGKIVSIVSDYLTQRTGFYKLYLPAGSYTLHANSINTLFNGGSGIGPYASDINDRSFTCPHPIPEVTFQDQNTGSNAILTITNGQSQTIDFTIDEKTTVLSVCDNNDSNNGSSSDLFGSMSHITLLTSAALLLLGRLRLRS